MVQNPFQHEVISASAGSGKTFQLSHRVVRLLAADVPPDRIVALTFSRKAAGEMFDAVLNLLARAAGDEAEAVKVAAAIEHPGLGRAAFSRLLRRLVGEMHRCRIGTLDSFNIGVLRAFPLEFGLSGEFDILSADQARLARRQVMEQVFSRLDDDNEARLEFLEAFKRATFGHEVKRLTDLLDEYLQSYHGRFQELQDGRLWGEPEGLWPQGSPFDLSTQRDGKDLEKKLVALAAAVDSSDLKPKQIERFEVFLMAAREFSPPRMAAEVKYIVERAAPVLEGLRLGSATMTVGAKTVITGALATALAEVVTHILAEIVDAYMRNTRGVHSILRLYEGMYDTLVRREGRLTFQDVTWLLGRGEQDPAMPLLSQAEEDAMDRRLAIDFRLDSRLDHWLLDEFQDTSDSQFRVLRPLIDEVLQDPGGQRSFFYVGDVKQAIHGWRGGNAWLFESLMEQYGEVLHETRMDASYRSCPPVIEAVNVAFRGILADDRLLGPVRRHWQTLWGDHISARQELAGCTALLEVEGKDMQADRVPVIVGLLRELDPVARGLSVAILVRSNRVGPEIVDALRRALPGLPVAWEGDYSIVDTPVVAAFLALFKAAAHPGDTLAWKHLQMTPLAPCVDALATEQKRSGQPADVLCQSLLATLHADGFRGVVADWSARLEAVTTLDAFGRGRLAELLAAASAFDATGVRDIPSFIDFVREYRSAELATESAVRVLTMHRSKGLGFDVVILPDLQAGSMVSAGALGLTARRDRPGDDPEWVMIMPPRDVSTAVPELALGVAQADVDDCNESLCLLYVALTRAKQGMYVIGSEPKSSPDAYSFVRQALLGHGDPTDWPQPSPGGAQCLYLSGDPTWYTARQPAPAAPAAAAGKTLAFGDIPRGGQRQRPLRVRPSDEHGGELKSASALFSDDRRSLEFGSGIHGLFEQLEWLDETDVETVIADWQSSTELSPTVQGHVVAQFRQALAPRAVQRALSRPAGHAAVWRERRFEIVLDGRWISGTFDRVTVRYADQSAVPRAVEAVILDYKSDRVKTDEDVRAKADYYRPQLLRYRQVLARMLNLPPERIRCELLFTGAGRLVDVTQDP